ncbi:MAG: 2-hydroxyacid dehydrogenase [Salinarimonadaceae bacterium]|nr:MAG: 2-hydroxyacid dehydrogenase [Salinarimonadaceae bacterium]
MKKVLLVAQPVPARLLAALSEHCTVLGPVENWPEPGEDARLADTQAVLIFGNMRFDAATMDRFPRLELICCYASGYDGVDLEGAKVRGVAVAHSPAANAPAVADLALGLIIATVRRIVEADRLLRSEGWASARGRPVAGLTGRTVGIYGLGAVGREIADRALSFGMSVAYHNRRRAADVPYPYFDSLRALAASADILVIAARADDANRRAVNAEILEALGPGGFLINIARGSIVDEDALVAALHSGHIAGAGLDVFTDEPNIDARLLQCPNIVLTPHMGGYTREAGFAVQELILDNLRALAAGQAPPYLVQT